MSDFNFSMFFDLIAFYDRYFLMDLKVEDELVFSRNVLIDRCPEVPHSWQWSRMTEQ